MCSLLLPAGKHQLLRSSLLLAERPVLPPPQPRTVIGEGDVGEMQNEEWVLQAGSLVCGGEGRGEVLKFIPKDTEFLKEILLKLILWGAWGNLFWGFSKIQEENQDAFLPLSLLPPISMELTIKSDKQICLWELPTEGLGPKAWRTPPLDSTGSWLKQVISPQWCVYGRRASSSIHWGFYLSASAPSHKYAIRSNND